MKGEKGREGEGENKSGMTYLRCRILGGGVIPQGCSGCYKGRSDGCSDNQYGIGRGRDLR